MGERNNPLLKKLDKWVGCPLIFGLGLFHRDHPCPVLSGVQKPRIALIKTAAVGDTIVLSAMVREIRHTYPEAIITVICTKNNLAMVKILPGIDAYYSFEMKKPLASLHHIKSLGSFDLLLDFGPWPRINSIIAWKADAAFKVGFKRPDTHRHYIYDAKVIHSDKLHEIENYRNILRAAQIPIVGYIPEFRTKEQLRPQENYVVFHLYPGGAMEMQRSWPNSRWLELGKQLYQRYGTKILFSGGPADKEKAEIIASQMQQNGVPAENIAGMYSLKEMASILQYAKVVVLVNTGIMHYAAAVGVPLVAIHGATSVTRWGPLSEHAVVVKSNVSCQPCISLGFESKCTNPVCMDKVTVDMVMDKVNHLLED